MRLTLLSLTLCAACAADRKPGTDGDDLSDALVSRLDGAVQDAQAQPSDAQPSDALELGCDLTDRRLVRRGETESLFDGLALDLDVQGDVAYLTHDRGVAVVNVAHLDSPFGVAHHTALGAHGLALTPDGFGVLAVVGDGVRVLDLRDDRTPHEVGAFDLVGAAGAEYAHDLALIGDQAYVAAGALGLWVVDVSVRPSPTPIGSCCGDARRHPLAGARDVEVRSGTAWVADSEDGLLVVDVANPRRPRLLSTTPLAHPARALHLGSDVGYLIEDNDTLATFALGPPTPRIREGQPLPAGTVALHAREDALFVASADGIHVLHPTTLEDLVPPLDLDGRPALALLVVGTRLYVAVPHGLVIASFDCL